MKFYSKNIFAVLVTAFSSTLFLLLRYAKVSPIVGSYFSFFSLSDVLMPLSGNFGFGFAGLLLALRFLVRVVFVGAPLTALVYHVPGMCASAYWATENKLICLVIPAACMMAFFMNPIGLQVAPYALYWLIPMGLFFVKRKTVFLHALASTFIAHAVGSVIWLYLHPMPAEVWWSLIPIVPIERIAFAGGMTMAYYAYLFFKELLFGGTTADRIVPESALS